MWRPNMNIMRTFDVLPVVRLQSNQHRIELSLIIKRLLLQMISLPSRRDGRKLSDETLAMALKRLEVPATAHGMRSTFRDWCEEMTGFPHEVKEAALYQLARRLTHFRDSQTG